MDFSDSTVNLSWVVPVSLQVSTPPTISHYVLSNNLTNGTKTFNNPTTCNPLAFCNYSMDRRDPFFTSVASDGNGNTTILDYNGIVEFTFFAVNGAGNGNAFTYIPPRRTPTDVPNQTIPAAGNTSSTPASNNTTSEINIYGTASVCAVLGTIIVVIVVGLVIAVIYYFKRKQRTPNDIGNERAVNSSDGLSNDCSSRAIGGNTSCTPEQSTAL
eukprot:Em0010g612a